MRLMFAALFAAILAAPLPVTAQDADTEKSPPAAQETSPETEPKIDVTRNGDWEVACQEVEFEGKTTKTCEMRQILVQKETQKEWLRVAVSFTPDTKKPILRIFTPLGVLLQPGMEIKIDDGEPQRVQYAVCLARPPRCLVAGALLPGWLYQVVQLAATVNPIRFGGAPTAIAIGRDAGRVRRERYLLAHPPRAGVIWGAWPMN